MSSADEFAAVRRDPDPIRRGRRATDLLALYQQRSTELARLRREALEQAYELGHSYTEIAQAMGVTKGRVTQIRASAPPAARALFGVGPVTIVLPERFLDTDRLRPLLASEDVEAGDVARRLLERFDFAVRIVRIGPNDTELPEGDLFVICGPKSSPAVLQLLDGDPRLNVVEDANGWHIENRQTGDRFGAPLDGAGPGIGELAYIARRADDQRTVVHVAGLRAIGSLGAVEFLASYAAKLYANTVGRDFSMIVESHVDSDPAGGLMVSKTEPFGDALLWDS